MEVVMKYKGFAVVAFLFTAAAHAQFNSIQPLPASRYHHGAATGPDGFVYIVGGVQQGQCSATMERYNARAFGPWSAALPMPKGARCVPGVVTGADGYIYVIGGTKPDGTSTKDVERFNTATQQWETYADLNVARSRPAVAVGRDLRIYVLGGYDAATKTEVDSIEVLNDPNVIQTSTSARVGITGIDGEVYAFGHGPGAVWGRFDGVNWIQLGTIQPQSDEADYIGAAAPDGLMYLLGVGHLSKINGSIGVAPYSPSGFAGSPPALITSVPGRVRAGAAAVSEGRIFVTGGHGGGVVHEMNAAEASDPFWAPLFPGATAWFAFDEANGSTVIDSWGGNTATALGNPKPVRLSGRVYKALRLLGTQSTAQYVRVEDSPGVNFDGGDMTIEGWVRWQPLSYNSLTTLIDKRKYLGGNKYQGYSLFFYKGGVGFQLANGSSYVNYGLPTSKKLPTNQWVHIAVTLDRQANQLRMYVNGALDQTWNNPLSGSTSNTAPLFIGRHSLSAQYFKGFVDELTFYDRALGWAELQAIFLAGREGKLP
jgi:Concanavalin A-like lectin/glucanases superfamily/Kelch motif